MWIILLILILTSYNNSLFCNSSSMYANIYKTKKLVYKHEIKIANWYDKYIHFFENNFHDFHRCYLWVYHFENEYSSNQGFFIYVYEKDVKPPGCIYTGGFSYNKYY